MKTEEWGKFLGVISDSEIAKRFEVTRSKVVRRRYALGIPAIDFASNHRRWTKAELQKLGTVSDEQLARELKTTTRMVQLARHKNGIAPFDPRADHRAGATRHWGETCRPEIVAAVRRAQKLKLTRDQIVYIFSLEQLGL